MKVGVLVVAYNAETTLRWVLDRIPVAAAHRPRRSAGDGRSLGRRHLRRRSRLHRRRHRHPADDRPPRRPTSATAATRRPATATPSTTAGTSSSCSTATASTRRRRCPICSPRSPTAVPANRWMPCSARGCSIRAGARRGGMPLYKYVGNRILTRTQNRDRRRPAERVALGLPRLPGVGARRPALRRQQRRLRLRHRDHPAAARQRTAGSVEVPIPTYYGDEISRVNGIAYARAIVIDTIRHRLGQAGFGTGRPRSQGRAVRVQAVARQLARHRPRDDPDDRSVCACSTSAAGPGGSPPNSVAEVTTSPASTSSPTRASTEPHRSLLRGRPRARPARRRRRRVRRRDRRRRDRARPQPGRAAGRPRRSDGDTAG